MALHYEMTSSEMFTKLMGPEVADMNNMKDYILKTYNSMEELKNKSNQAGNWQAKADLSLAYRDGIPELNVEKDLDSAIGWLESSVQNGNPLPGLIFNLGTLYDVKGTPLYQRKAYEMYMKAARLGSVPAEFHLAEIYRCGVEGVVTEDLEEAFKWYRRAVDEESVDLDELGISHEALKMRGTLRRLGIDTKIKALTLLHKNYMSGDCPEGRPQPQKALYYLKKAATLGDIQSQKELGLTYLTGVSEVPKDLEKAKRWLEKAANHGNIEAKEVLKKFDQPNIVESVAHEPEADQQNVESTMKQYFDIFEKQIEKNKLHPFVIENPLMFQESMFTQFPNSPTAQHYLKAFRLTKEGLDKLQKGSFKEAIKLMALGFLYENTVLNTSFPEVHHMRYVIVKIFEELKVNDSFFEGLLLLFALYTQPKEASTLNFGSLKIDLKKTMFLKNLIFLIEKYESADRLPKQNPYNFEEDYSSWLHMLYYLLGSLYTIAERFDDGAQAFEKALKCCPTYYEAKLAFAYCLMNIFTYNNGKDLSKEMKNVSCNPEGPEDQDSASKYLNQRVPKCSYLRFTQDKLKQKAEQLYLEYLEEAPVCDKKYPNCCYHLAYLYLVDENIQKAHEWKEKGEDAEEKRLPFMEPVSANSKDLLICLDMLPIPKKVRGCSYKGCSSKPTDQLKSCPCKEAIYCGRECQKMDWKEHKKTCSKRAKAKEK